MKIHRQKVNHGWRTEITDPDTKEKWQGNITKTIGKANESAVDGFIKDKRQTILELKKRIRANEDSITKLLDLL